MITRRTKIQLLVFVIITLVGVSFVGARYARLDRLVMDTSYTVVAHFDEAGGIFAGGEVTYRGVGIGRVDKLVLTGSGVDVHLAIDNEHDEIPADTVALVGNRSAVGEQYVELQPKVDDGPVLEDGSEIDVDDTRVPLRTEKLLADLSDTASSVDQESLRTTINELGTAFDDTGEDLQRIIDTGTSFIQEADANFDLTTALIRDSNTVLGTQLDTQSALRTFASQLSLFSGSLAGADEDLRRLIDTGSGTATQLRTFLEQNQVELGDLLNNLVTTGEITVRNLDGIKQLLVVYPYAVEGGFTVVSKTPETGLYDAHFGLVLTTKKVCKQGYDRSEKRTPQDRDDIPMDTDARCTEPAAVSNARGAQNLDKAPGAAYRAPVVASYDPETGDLTWGDRAASAPRAAASTVAPSSLGKDSWKWLYLAPLMAPGE